MKRTRRSEFTPLDFLQWRAGSALVLSPKFQRRGIWKPAARSFFIDSLLLDMPVPPIYLRETQSEERDRIIREVVDGQQRISAVLDYMDNKYRLATTMDKRWAGKTFNALKADHQDRIRDYSFSVEIFAGLSDLQVLEVFSRLNTYSVALNKQELRNGRFFGHFKRSVYSIGFEHLEFWRRHKIFTEQAIARMGEAEFVSEIYIAFSDGMQDKKTSIDSYYETYDESFPYQKKVENRLKYVVDEINNCIGDVLSSTPFRRLPLLYTLFCVIYHRRYGLEGVDAVSPKLALKNNDRLSLRNAVEILSDQIRMAREHGTVSKKHGKFVEASSSQTDNIRPRQTRFAHLYAMAFGMSHA